MAVKKTHQKITAGRPEARDGEDSEPPGSSAGCHIDYQLQTADCRPASKRWLPAQLSRIAQLAGVTEGVISLVLVDDDQMSTMHAEYSGIPGTTDILTFNHRDDASQPMEADLILCKDVAAREGQSRGHETRLELLLYAVHGLNHLLGGDDHTAAGARKMHAWEDRMLTAAGLGAVFHRPDQRDDKATASSKSNKSLTKQSSTKSTKQATATKSLKKRRTRQRASA